MLSVLFVAKQLQKILLTLVGVLHLHRHVDNSFIFAEKCHSQHEHWSFIKVCRCRSHKPAQSCFIHELTMQWLKASACINQHTFPVDNIH